MFLGPELFLERELFSSQNYFLSCRMSQHVVVLHGEEGAVSASGVLLKTHSHGIQHWRVISGWISCLQPVSTI